MRGKRMMNGDTNSYYNQLVNAQLLDYIFTKRGREIRRMSTTLGMTK